MFERYTERARRVLFFARYEASQLGSISIETEHLLLGLIREGKGLTSRIFARSHLSLENIRKEIEGRTVFREKNVLLVFVETDAGKRFTARAVVIAGGVGSFAVQIAKARGAGYLRLSVDDDNVGAQRFYQRMGFKQSTPELIYVLDNDTFMELADAGREMAGGSGA